MINRLFPRALAAIALPACLLFVGCNDGPLENAGEAIEDTAEDIGDGVEDAVD